MSTKLKQPDAADQADVRSVVIPVVEERALIAKRKALAEGVRVRTVVHEREEVIDEALATESVDVERVPLDRWVEEPIPVRQEGDTTIITLVEEVVVVEKRLRATEEVRITRRHAVRNEPQAVTLRREEAVIERLDPGEASAKTD